MSSFNEKPLGRGELRVEPEADGKLDVRFGHFSRFPVGGLWGPAESFLTITHETTGPLDTLILAGQDDPEAVALVVKQLRELQAREAD